MPIYSVKCTACSQASEVWCSYEELQTEKCSQCNGELSQQLTPFAKHGSWSAEYAGYYDRGLGCYVESYHHRKKLMKEKGLRPVDHKELDDGIDKSISDTQKHDKIIKQLGG